MAADAKKPEPADDLVDYRKVSTKVAQRAIDRLLDFAETKIKQSWARYKNFIKAEFARYIQAQRVRCSLIRTLIYNNQSTQLVDAYVPLNVRVYRDAGRSQQSSDINSSELISLLFEERDPKKHRKTFAGAISGLAGAGKSFFMRNLYLELTAREISWVPVFLEARELNGDPLLEFANLIVKAFKISGCNISVEQATEGLKSGIFCVLIDGFDELRVSHERHYAVELDRAAEAYGACPILVSGRPSELLLSSNHFDNCELLPLRKEQSIELIEKLKFDERVKKSFVTMIRRELWESHKEFLEIPLLCTVMLITYSDAGRISYRQHEFYEDAYNALWSKHDARKQAGYEREKYTRLDKQEFLKLASAFCASSYISEDFSMREWDISKHLEQAKKLSGVSASLEAFIKDMTVSTSLLVVDGNHFKFSHRSFQEFLCANYVLELGDQDFARGIEAVSGRFETDEVLSFVKSMNSERFESAWVIPKLAALINTIKIAKGQFASYRSLVDGENGEFLMKLREIYELTPTNQQILAAIDSRRHMGQAAVKDFGRLNSSQEKLFSRDMENFVTLFSQLDSHRKTRDQVLGALFRER